MRASLALAAVLVATTACAAEAREPQIVFWKAGEDALTTRFHAALDGGRVPECTVPCIVAVVREVRPDGPSGLSYSIDVAAPASADKVNAPLGRIDGACAEIDLAICARDIRTRIEDLATPGAARPRKASKVES